MPTKEVWTLQNNSLVKPSCHIYVRYLFMLDTAHIYIWRNVICKSGISNPWLTQLKIVVDLVHFNGWLTGYLDKCNY